MRIEDGKPCEPESFDNIRDIRVNGVLEEKREWKNCSMTDSASTVLAHDGNDRAGSGEKKQADFQHSIGAENEIKRLSSAHSARSSRSLLNIGVVPRCRFVNRDIKGSLHKSAENEGLTF